MPSVTDLDQADPSQQAESVTALLRKRALQRGDAALALRWCWLSGTRLDG
jgi:hypothetical protein